MQKYNCLIVEDSPVMRQLLVSGLSRIKGMSVVETDDGVEGLKTLKQNQFDLVIIDINMPIMDGLKLVKHIRSGDTAKKDVPIIVVTTEQEDMQRALQLGVNAYFTKPIRFPDVLIKVKELLEIEDTA